MGERVVDVTYRMTDEYRILQYRYEDQIIVLTTPISGYSMVVVRRGPDGPAIEQYYSLTMAVEHAADLLGVQPADLDIPIDAADMGL